MIPCYGRPDDLRRTLRETRRQTYCSFETVIIDDGTPDDTVAMAAREFPECRYVRLAANVGLIGARNQGAAQCRGEYIVNLDDDSWLVEPDALTQIVTFLDKNTHVAVAALNVRQPASGLAWPLDKMPFPSGNYSGGGNVQRRAVTLKIGGYIAEFVRQGEELEHTMRIIDAGYAIMALPGIEVFHNESAVNRNIRRIRTFEAVNLLRREALRAPAVLLPLGVTLFFKFIVVHYRGIDWSLMARLLFSAPSSMATLIRKYRKPVQVASYLKCLRLRRATAGG